MVLIPHTLIGAVLCAGDTKINGTGSLLVCGSRVDSLEKTHLRSPDKRRGRVEERAWS